MVDCVSVGRSFRKRGAGVTHVIRQARRSESVRICMDVKNAFWSASRGTF